MHMIPIVCTSMALDVIIMNFTFNLIDVVHLGKIVCMKIQEKIQQ